MAIMTISISDETAQKLREEVIRKLGDKKGVLGKAIEEAIKNWLEEKEQKEIAERQKEKMKKGLYSLKGWKFNREEVHER